MSVLLFWWHRNAPIQKYNWYTIQRDWKARSRTQPHAPWALLCPSQGKWQSQYWVLSSTWFFHVCLYMCMFIHIYEKNNCTAKHFCSVQHKNFKSDMVKILFLHHPWQLTMILYVFVQRYSIKAPPPAYSFSCHSQALYFRPLCI